MFSHPKVVSFLRCILKQNPVLNHINSKTSYRQKKKKNRKKCPDFWDKQMCSHMERMFMNTFTKNILRHNFANLGIWINLWISTTIWKMQNKAEKMQVGHSYSEAKYFLVQSLFQLCLYASITPCFWLLCKKFVLLWK